MSIPPNISIYLCDATSEQFFKIQYKDPLSHYKKWLNIFLFSTLEIKFLWTEATTGTGTKTGHFLRVDKAWLCHYQLKEKRKLTVVEI